MVTLLARRGAILVALSVTALASITSSASAVPAIDQSFGSRGFVTPSVFPKKKKDQTARGVAIQSDGRVVVPMTLPISYGHRSRRPVIRLNADGTRDRSYGHKGVAWVRAGGAPFITLRGAKSFPGDGTLIWGEYYFDGGYDPAGVFVTKLSPNGKVDRKFGDQGSRRFSMKYAGIDTEFIDASPTADGGVSVSITTYSLKRENETIRTTKLNVDGAVDRSFGVNGTRTFRLDRKTFLAGYAGGVLINGGSLYMAIYARGGCIVRRYVLAGSVPPDQTFGLGGQVKTGVVGMQNAALHCGGLIATSSGGVLVHGSTNTSSKGPNGYLQRLNPDGSVDLSLGPGGVAVVPELDVVARAIELPGGSVLMAGDCGDIESFSGCLRIVDAAGAPVESFGKAGTMEIGKYDFASQLAASGTSAVALIERDEERSNAKIQLLKLVTQ